MQVARCLRTLAVVCCAMAATARACARVTHISISSRAPVPVTNGIRYEVVRGYVFGELNPEDVRNRIVQDLALAPRNSKGMVEYEATFTLYRPVDAGRSSHLLVYEVANRGASIIPRDLTTGDTYLVSGWQGDLKFGGKSVYGSEGQTVEVPVARAADGSPVTGKVMARFADLQQGLKTFPLAQAIGYASSGAPPQPVTLDTGEGSLTWRTYQDLTGVEAGVVKVPSTDWSWGNCAQTPFPGTPDPAHLCLKGGFRSDALYQLVYTAKDPLILGVGLAAMRDTISFFRYEPRDEAGAGNPIAGDVHAVIAEGASQAGNLIRTFLNLGMNEDEKGRKVCDGAMPLIAVRQTPVNFRFAIPGGASNLYEPGSEGVLWWGDWPDAARENPTSGLLHRCSLTSTCPKIMEVIGSSEFYALRASPDFTGSAADRDIPLPANVRRYYIASTQHGGGAGGFRWQPRPVPAARAPTVQNPIVSAPCVLPQNPNPEKEIDRALLDDLKLWVMQGKEPPPSRYPTLAGGDLLPEAQVVASFPQIPQLPSLAGIANPIPVYDFGSHFAANDISGTLGMLPPTIIGRLAMDLPAVDRDGNEVGGVHTILHQAPLGTYLGWNITSSGFNKGRFCSLAGSYIPFAKTHAERIAGHDTRLSLEERYTDHAGYVQQVKQAAAKLVAQRLLLSDDADRVVGEAEASDVLLAQPMAAKEEKE